MLNSTPLVASIVVAIAGALILWSNPERRVNRVVFTCSLNIALWLFLLHLALTSPRGSAAGLFWLRCACTVGGSTLLHFWLVKDSIAAGGDNVFVGKWIRSNWWLLAVSLVLMVIPFTDFFIPSHSTATSRLHGWGYSVFNYGILALFTFLFVTAFRNIKKLDGARRLELQVWLGGGCAMGVTVLGLMALNTLTRDPLFVRMQSFVVLIFYAGTAFAITTYRIFDARQILLVCLEKFILIGTSAAVAFFLDQSILRVLPAPFDFLATTALVLWFAATLNSWLDRKFQFYPQATAARQAAYAAARRELNVESLERSIASILEGWGQTDHAVVVSGAKGLFRGIGAEIAKNSAAVEVLHELRWATPERLNREKSTPERKALAGLLRDQRLGVLVLNEGPTLTVLVGVGIPASRRPFTYPQVMQLLELSSIVESALERLHYSGKAQQAEQLATVGLMGASLAHEIRNPLVTIKTFVQLLPQHHQDSAFRDKFFRLIGDEVSRIDRLTEQLLDMASPRDYDAVPTELHPLLRAGLDLVATKADHRQVRVITQFDASPDLAVTDAAATKQVLLNLCFNAIHAVENRDGERWIRIATRNVPAGIEVAVTDNGAGISPEILPRLFQPFQTTKSTGFGLGLAICSDILSGLKATIAADPPRPGEGATFRVHFPCPPVSS